MKYYGYALCKKCQTWFNEDKASTQHSKRFYLALKVRKVNVSIEQFDGHKHIDIAIKGKDLPLNIEIDGSQHYTSIEQSYADLLRTFHSFVKDYYTLRLPNILVAERLEETADVVVEMLNHLRNKRQQEQKYRQKVKP